MLIQKNEKNSIDIACKFLKQNQIVILPTDTLYGFSGLINKTEDKIISLKDRNSSKGLISLIADPQDIFKYTDSIISKSLLNSWPAPLTLIVKEKNANNSLAFRCPDDLWLRTLIVNLGSPIYSTSVNYSNHPPLTTPTEIQSQFEDKVALIVCDGIKKSVASTIVSLLDSTPKVLRQGNLKLEF